MYKKLLILAVISTLFWIWIYYYINYIYNPTSKKETKIIKNEILNLEEINQNDEENLSEIKEIDLDKEERIEMLRKRFTLKWTISRWDSYASWNQPILALNEYLKALRQSPNDEQIIKKLSLVYFDLKRFSKVIETYKQVLSTLNDKEKEIYILSSLYNLDFTSSTQIKSLSEEIRNLWFSKEETFYYINSINCTISFHECKKNYETYFKNYPDFQFEKLKNIQKAINNYKNFQIDNLYYKDALIIWAFFQDKLYSVSNILSKKLLNEKVDYKPIILVAWKWYYELWDLENAKIYLEKYYSLDPKDLNITYILWDISFKLKDYATSNLYFNSALKNWFEPKIELQRKLAYNYYLSWDKRSMINVFWYLIDEKDSSIDDYSLWIYHAILEWRNSNAVSWSLKWIEKFKNQEWYEIFYWYLGWINREEKNFQKAREYLKQWNKINSKNPLITLNLWYLEEYQENYNLALLYFKRTININWDGEFWELAKEEIKQIEKYLEISKKEKKQ